jgi:hypothetical protein
MVRYPSILRRAKFMRKALVAAILSMGYWLERWSPLALRPFKTGRKVAKSQIMQGGRAPEICGLVRQAAPRPVLGAILGSGLGANPACYWVALKTNAASSRAGAAFATEASCQGSSLGFLGLADTVQPLEDLP